MSEAGYTPGPWRWELGFLVGADGMLVLQKPFAGVDAPIDKVHISNPADKMLIQAAPELYAALETLLKAGDSDKAPGYSEVWEYLQPFFDRAAAALAAARGEKTETVQNAPKT